MVKLKKEIKGELVIIEFTAADMIEINRQQHIIDVRNIFYTYQELIPNFDDVIEDEEILLKYYEILNNEILENTGADEIEAIEKLFNLN